LIIFNHKKKNKNKKKICCAVSPLIAKACAGHIGERTERLKEIKSFKLLLLLHLITE
jgi:hypothetical protein